RWPDEFRDEVLARLLELNEQRHKEELKAGVVAAEKEKKSAKKKRKPATKRVSKQTDNESQAELF
ncbi:hypothetical protein ACFL2H_05205, partial [Planctomycetota bacterium]